MAVGRPHQAVRHHPNGRVYQIARGGIIQDSVYSAVWAQAGKEGPRSRAVPGAGSPGQLHRWLTMSSWSLVQCR
jgi:hypothetical protein